MSIQKFTYLLLLVLVSTSAISQSTVDSILFDFYNRPDRVLVAAHRAPHSAYPENSLAAMKEAIRLGVDIIETDVRETKDSVLVCIHDKTIDRTTTGKGKVENMTYAELQNYYLLHEGKPTLQKIPTLEEVLVLIKGKIMLDIDYKADGKRAALAITKLLRDMDMEKQCLFFLYDYNDAKPLYKMNNQLQFLVRAYTPEDIDSILKMKEPSYAIHGDDNCYSNSLMKQIRSSGKRVWMNSLGKYDDMERIKKDSGFTELLQKKQTNMIQTDLPEELLKYLREKDLHR